MLSRCPRRTLNWRSGGLERGHLLELRGRGLETQKEGIGVHAPVVLWAALHAAIGARADAVEARGIHDRQRFEHDGVNKGEDGSGCSDAEGQREHGCQGEDRRQPHLPKRVRDILPQGFHAGYLRAEERPGSSDFGSFTDTVGMDPNKFQSNQGDLLSY